MRSLSRGEGTTYSILEAENYEEDLFLVKGITSGTDKDIQQVSCLGAVDADLEDLEVGYVGGRTIDGNWSSSKKPWDNDDLRFYNFYGSILNLDTENDLNPNERNELETYAHEALGNEDMLSKIDRLYATYQEESESIRSVKL